MHNHANTTIPMAIPAVVATADHNTVRENWTRECAALIKVVALLIYATGTP